MTESQMIILGSICAYFLFMILIGFMASRRQTHEGFVIGSRNVGYIPTIGSLASSTRDGMGFIIWFGFGASAGYGGISFLVGLILSLLLYSFIGPKVRKMSKEHGYVTIGEMLRAQMGGKTEKLTGVVILAIAIIFISMQLYVSGNLFAEVLQIDAWVGILSVATVVGFYLFLGGYNTVVKTDAVQFFLILSLLIVPFYLPPARNDLFDFGSVFALGPKTFVALFLIGFAVGLGSAENWQRVFSAKNDNVIRYGFPAAGIFLALMTLNLIFMGMAARPYLGDSVGSDDAFYQLFKMDFVATPLLAYIAVVVMAICMSTLDTLTYLSSATLAKNVFPEKITKTRDGYIRFSQVVMLLILIITSLFAVTLSDVILFAFQAASLLYILAPVYVYAALGYPKKRNERIDIAVSISMMCSVVIYIYMFSAGVLDDLILTLVPAVISIVLTSLSIFIVPKITAKTTGKGLA